MDENKFVIDSNLNLIEFLAMTESIADGYFDDDGNYQPHYGLINAMRLFYNVCVKQSKFDEKYPHNIVEMSDLDEIITDDYFRQYFYNEIYNGVEGINFNTAYDNAREIVHQRNSSVTNIGEQVKHMLVNFTDSISAYLNEDNLNKIGVIAQDIQNGKLSADSIVEAYGNSDRFQRVVSGEFNDDKASKKNTTKSTKGTKKKDTKPDLKVVE